MIPTIQAEPAIPNSLVGLLIVAVVALAGVVGFLFRYYSSHLSKVAKERREEDEEWHKERMTWAIERTKFELESDRIRAEYESKHREIIEKNAALMRSLFDASRDYESNARREYTANMAVVADKAAESSEKLKAILDRILERLMGSRSR